jgi:hypothetical protein
MNCQDVRTALIDYLADEISIPERRTIENHLRSCPACTVELNAISALQSQITHSLHQADQVQASPLALSRLQARLSFEGPAQPGYIESRYQNRIQNVFRQGINMMRRPAFALAAILILLFCTVAFVPTVRAQVQGIFEGWFGFESPDSTEFISIKTTWDFEPLNPAYLPKGISVSGSMVGGDKTTTQFGMCYQPRPQKEGDPFVTILQTKVEGAGELPKEGSINIRDHNAIFENLAAGEITWCFDPIHPVKYETANRLTWIENDVKIEITGPYPESELVKIARSMKPAQVSVGTEAPTPVK